MQDIERSRIIDAEFTVISGRKELSPRALRRWDLLGRVVMGAAILAFIIWLRSIH